MEVERIDYLTIYVKDLERAVQFFSEVMGSQFFGPTEKKLKDVPDELKETIKPSLGVRGAFDNMGLQLVQPLSPDDPIAKWINERGEGVASIGLKVSDINEAIAELESKGFTQRPGDPEKKRVSALSTIAGEPVGASDMKGVLMFPPENAYGLQFFLFESTYYHLLN